MRTKTASKKRGAVIRRDLLGLQDLPADLIRLLLRRAEHHREMLASNPDAGENILYGRIVANLFFEDSTRTRTSFSVAAHHLGADVVDLYGPGSSVSKGETLADTGRNVEAMGVDALVVRCKQSGGAASIAAAVKCAVINAGDGRHEHPTQGLLDTLTIATHFKRERTLDLKGLHVAIVGDVVSSRVGRSNIACLTALGGRVTCVGPGHMAPRSLEALGCGVSNDLDAVLADADVVMMLRIQFERHGEGGMNPQAASVEVKGPSIASVREYREFYALTPDRARRLKPRAVIMHPGPINRGIELDSEVLDGPRSLVMAQVTTGVAVRMAVLEWCCGADDRKTK